MASLWRRVVLLLGDCVLFYLSLFAAILVRDLHIFGGPYLVQHLVTFSMLFACWIVVFFIVGLYEPANALDLIGLIENVLAAAALNLALSVGVLYLFPSELRIAPKTHLVETIVFGHAAAFFWRHLLLRALLPLLPRRRVVFWGENPLFPEMAADLKRLPYLGYVPVDSKVIPERAGSESIDEYWRRAESRGRRIKDDVDLIVLDAAEVEAAKGAGAAILSAAIMDEIPIRTHLDFYEEIYRKIPPERAAKPNWLLSHVLQEKDPLDAIIKRALDFLVSFFGLLALSPLLALVAAASRLADGAGILYRQKRAGYHGREFFIWKFRTMREDAERSGPLYHSERRDSRVTPFGTFLRRFRLDELPQLVNVLLGEMSLVGPRPEWIEEVRLLERQVPHYHLRHLVKPGITGWAQINFRATSTARDSVEKLHYDLYYVKNASLALDLGILLKTAKRVFQREDWFDRRKSPERAHETAGR